MGRPQVTKRRIASEPRRRWQPAELAQLAAQYPHMKTAVIALMLDRTRSTVYQTAQRLGLTKSPEFYASPASGRTCGRQGMGSRFVKGQTSWNKGLSYRPGGRCSEGWFKPGIRQGVAVRLYKPIGTERVTKDGYLSRKVNDGMPLQSRWRLVHLIVWEAANGPIPKGHAVTFVNGDRKDVRLDNLALITRAALMKRNTIHNYPQPIPQLVQLRGALQRQINRKGKREQD